MNDDRELNAAVGRLAASFASAWNRHDAHAFAANFAQDADFTNVLGMQAKGRDAIEAFHRPVFESMFAESRLTIEDAQARPIRPEVAAVDMRWSMEGARDPSGGAWPRRKGLINMILVEYAGIWSIAVMHNMDLLEPRIAEAQARLQQAASA